MDQKDLLMGDKLIVIMAMIAGGLIVGFIQRVVFWPEVKTVVKEVLTTDTLIVEKTVTDTVFLDRVKLEKHIDTVYYSEEHEADISLYEGVEDIEYGQLFWKAETTGQLVSLKFNPKLTIPEKTITNTMERTVTNTVYSKGIYAGGLISDKLKPSISTSYIDKKYSFDYLYDVQQKSHSIGLKFKLL